jgi:hypothetical protein
MDPFANIDNGIGFSDWNYSTKAGAAAPAEKAKTSKSRRRSSMSIVPLDCHDSAEPGEDPNKEQRRQSRRSSLDLTLDIENKRSRHRGEPSVSSGLSAKSNGSRDSREKRGNSSSEDAHRRREGSRDDRAPRSDRKSKVRPDRTIRRHLSLGANKAIDFEDEVVQASSSKDFVESAEPRRTSKRASLNMVTNHSVSTAVPPQRRTGRRASLNMVKDDVVQSPAAEKLYEDVKPHRISRRASLNMVAGNSVSTADPPPRRNGRRGSLNATDRTLPTVFTSDDAWHSGGAKVHEWHDDGFHFIK